MTTRQLPLISDSQQRPFWPMRRLMAPKINCFYVHLAAAIPAEQHFGFGGRLSRRTDLRHYTFSYIYFYYCSYFSFGYSFYFSYFFVSCYCFFVLIYLFIFLFLPFKVFGAYSSVG